MNSTTNGTTVSVGPWGPAGDVLVSLFPLVVLVSVTIYGKGVPAYKSLPVISVLMALLRLAYFSAPPELVLGCFIAGALDALTPLSIVAGAIFLFEVMDITGSLRWFAREMGQLTQHEPVPQVMLIGWAFAYLVEGASGFGTPVVLSSRLLVELGHGPIEAICSCLIMNTLATIFGAVGTPVWFGFSGLGLSEEEFLELSSRQAVLNGICALIIPILALRMLVTWNDILKNIVFIYLSILSCVVPSVTLSFFSTEFPSLVGGLVGLACTAFLTARRQTSPGSLLDATNKEEAGGNGVEPVEENDSSALTDGTADKIEGGGLVNSGGQVVETEESEVDPDDLLCELGKEKSLKAIIWFTLPISLCILLLVLTRVKPIGLGDALRAVEPSATTSLGSLGKLSISATLVLQLTNIAGLQELSWKFETLYVPFISPFFLVAVFTLLLATKVNQLRPVAMYGEGQESGFRRVLKLALQKVSRKLKKPTIALIGALVLVTLFRKGGDSSPAFVVGSTIAEAVQLGWIAIATPLGAVGSFFSGSTTVSNLTFGRVHQIAAESIMVRTASILALQAVGGTMGNMICLANIVNVKAVLDVQEPEGVFIRRTLPVLLVYYVVSLAFGSLLFLILWK